MTVLSIDLKKKQYCVKFNNDLVALYLKNRYKNPLSVFCQILNKLIKQQIIFKCIKNSTVICKKYLIDFKKIYLF